jgi:hypothetical protein
MGLSAGLRRLLANWPELADAAGADFDAVELSSPAIGLAQDRLRELGEFADGLEDAAEAAGVRHALRFFNAIVEGRRWRHNPDQLQPWSAILLRHALLAESSPLEAERLGDRVASLPRALHDAAEGLQAPDPFALADARRNADRLRTQLDGLADLVPPTALQGAYLALAGHRRWLAELTPGPPLPPLGLEGLSALLHARGITRSIDDVILDAEQCLVDVQRTVEPEPESEEVLPAALVRDALRTELEVIAELARARGERVADIAYDVIPPPPGLEALEGAVLLPRPLRPREGARLLFGGESVVGRHTASRLLIALRDGPTGRGLHAALLADPARAHCAIDLCPLAAMGRETYAAETLLGFAHLAELSGAQGLPPRTQVLIAAQQRSRWHALLALAELQWHGVIRDDADTLLQLEARGLQPEQARRALKSFRLQPTRALSTFVGERALRELQPDRPGLERLLRQGRVPIEQLT